MNIRIVFSVIPVGRFYDDIGLLGGGSVIEVDEWFSVNVAFENREIFPKLSNINRCDFLNQSPDPRTLFYITRTTRYKFSN
jgi:hypothetical protein